MFILHKLLGVVRGMSPFDGVYPSDLRYIDRVTRLQANGVHNSPATFDCVVREALFECHTPRQVVTRINILIRSIP